MIISKQCVFKGVDCKDKSEALSFLADKLYVEGFVNEKYKEAILTREQNYPTGLPGSEWNIAIPHADFHLVNRTTIAAAILKQPVLFHSMDNIKKDIPVQIILMLAIKEPHGQIQMLQNVIQFIRNHELLKKIVDEYTEQQIVAVLQMQLNQKMGA
ncbi:PTS sugar transporter subunit IIA [Sporolactobacillus shoreicorticis]|uniref:PTS sugar transporter subunit IIA n=1 Tax=Sporolactobacillus shoreicorticis TaxID=1923877 RepID=A0ABW5S2B6_9BACL|nr:PTS sugar transporter subunit IIA [Sporolactobacillus shoreicorticis]MCO7125352.1 PTS sugar transporter subunit IIA [Sporolactobacillus shoreicorticis]